MKHLGFSFSETMSGTYTRAGEPDHARQIRFQARASAPRLLAHLRDGMTQLEGTLDMEGFADDVPITGTIEIRPVSKRVIRYDFSFVGSDGRPYRFAGQKDIRLGDLLATMTTCNGAILDERGAEIARATVRFDLKADLLPFLISWKAAFA